MTSDEIRTMVTESCALKQRFFDANAPRLLAIGRSIADRLLAGGRLLAFGNGGSAADAQHFVAELVVRLEHGRRALAAIALTTDPSVISAAANDLGYAAVFRRQVEAHGRPGDVALGISTSGRSANVLEGLCAARERGMLTLGLTGNGGATMPSLVDELIDVPHADTQRIQEVHGMVLHVLAQVVDEAARS